MNKVLPEHLANHIEYNKRLRPGRALFVDGKTINEGYYTTAETKAFEARIAENPEEFSNRAISAPYH